MSPRAGGSPPHLPRATALCPRTLASLGQRCPWYPALPSTLRRLYSLVTGSFAERPSLRTTRVCEQHATEGSQVMTGWGEGKWGTTRRCWVPTLGLGQACSVQGLAGGRCCLAPSPTPELPGHPPGGVAAGQGTVGTRRPCQNQRAPGEFTRHPAGPGDPGTRTWPALIPGHRGKQTHGDFPNTKSGKPSQQQQERASVYGPGNEVRSETQRRRKHLINS